MEEINDKIIGAEKDYFIESKSASSTAIAAVLLFGIIFSVFSVIHLGYFPEWKADQEHSHVANVWEDMTELKSKMDRTTISLMLDPNSSTPKVTTTTTLHTGRLEIPIIGVSRSSGIVSINADTCKMTVIPANSTEKIIINCGTIAYRSNNRYYMDQVFKYENGALILEQEEQAVMKLYPAIRVFEASPGNFSFLINAIEIQSLANTLSSNSDCSIRLKDQTFVTLYDSDTFGGNVNSFELELYTDHPDAWKAYFDEIMVGAGLKENEDYTLNKGNDHLKLSFPNNKKSTNTLDKLYVGKTTVKADLGIGLS